MKNELPRNRLILQMSIQTQNYMWGFLVSAEILAKELKKYLFFLSLLNHSYNFFFCVYANGSTKNETCNFKVISRSKALLISCCNFFYAFFSHQFIVSFFFRSMKQLFTNMIPSKRRCLIKVHLFQATSFHLFRLQKLEKELTDEFHFATQFWRQCNKALSPTSSQVAVFFRAYFAFSLF